MIILRNAIVSVVGICVCFLDSNVSISQEPKVLLDKKQKVDIVRFNGKQDSVILIRLTNKEVEYESIQFGTTNKTSVKDRVISSITTSSGQVYTADIFFKEYVLTRDPSARIVAEADDYERLRRQLTPSVGDLRTLQTTVSDLVPPGTDGGRRYGKDHDGLICFRTKESASLSGYLEFALPLANDVRVVTGDYVLATTKEIAAEMRVTLHFKYSIIGGKASRLMVTDVFLKESNTGDIPTKIRRSINYHRIKNRLNPLIESRVLSRVAEAHSREMSRVKQVEHIIDGKGLEYRLAQFEYDAVAAAQNLNAKGRLAKYDAFAVVSSWANTDSTRDRMLTPEFTEIGVGVVDDYFTAVFAVPKK